METIQVRKVIQILRWQNGHSPKEQDEIGWSTMLKWIQIGQLLNFSYFNKNMYIY